MIHEMLHEFFMWMADLSDMPPYQYATELEMGQTNIVRALDPGVWTLRSGGRVEATCIPNLPP